MTDDVRQYRFVSLKRIGIYKKGHIFTPYGGLVSGVGGISFLDKEYFAVCYEYTH